ncbi:AraC family transcriptional regulator [Dinghuibacter silviterrae]|uniref:AraC family transcriptional regulator n=1 Tax=Dinghuibacter silviterrae TaxID=1539049 RepID=A0A4R8DNL8_9BACT|nr:AraC family transcriptional regulator [Dinghuibacter silviterrae]TDW99014.1 AraC family transcriptional regulator [Dinghuibacter silviterrae]
MSLLSSLADIDKSPKSVFVMHERSEKHFPFHTHLKGQLSYVEGGLAYLGVLDRTYVIPALHYFWVPPGVGHILKLGHSGTVLRSIFYYSTDDKKNEFYVHTGIYPVNDLLLQMIRYTAGWERHIPPADNRFGFLKAIKDILPSISEKVVPVVLPFTEDEEMTRIINYMGKNLHEQHTLHSIARQFNMSSRSLSRTFQRTVQMSFLQYLKAMRMAKAFELIVKDRMSLSEIAYAVGYNSLSAFSNTFHQYTDFRPSDFARRPV